MVIKKIIFETAYIIIYVTFLVTFIFNNRSTTKIADHLLYMKRMNTINLYATPHIRIIYTLGRF